MNKQQLANSVLILACFCILYLSIIQIIAVICINVTVVDPVAGIVQRPLTNPRIVNNEQLHIVFFICCFLFFKKKSKLMARWRGKMVASFQLPPDFPSKCMLYEVRYEDY